VSVEILVVCGQSLVIFVFLVVALSRLGRSHMAGLTPIGYLVIALLGSAVETGLYHASASLGAGLASAATVILADHLITRLLNRFPRLRRWLCGGPVVLIHDGKVLAENLRRVRMTEQDLCAAVRDRGYGDLSAVHLAVMAADGSVGVIPKKAV
jgi:uncharacterized membrane protein YcaP (DUF421 family)